MRVAERVRQKGIAGMHLKPISRISNWAMACRVHMEYDGLVAAADANFMAADFEWHPLVSNAIALPRRVELLDVKILYI